MYRLKRDENGNSLYFRPKWAFGEPGPSGFTFGEANLVTYDTRKAPKRGLFLYRGNQIRTDDILLPKQTLYQAELHPECVQI